MEIFNNFKELFLSVWNKGILGVDIFQILIGIAIFFIFLIFRGIISRIIIKRLESIAKKTTNKLDDTFVHAMEGPARFLPIVIGFFIASYYMSFSEDSRVVVDTINRTLSGRRRPLLHGGRVVRRPRVEHRAAIAVPRVVPATVVDEHEGVRIVISLPGLVV